MNGVLGEISNMTDIEDILSLSFTQTEHSDATIS